MITLTELKKKAQRPWVTGSFLKSWLADESLFPLEIPFRTPSGRTLGSDFARVRDWIVLLQGSSKAATGSGYVLEYRTINHQQLGRQKVPGRILFESRDDWLAYIGQQKAFRQFDELAGSTRRMLPEVMAYMAAKPLQVIEYAESWPGLLKVCRYFQLNPRPNRYIRQLDIPGVDSKFIEGHRGILSELLTLALDPEDYDETLTGLAENGFERRFGLCFDEPLIRFRLLDTDGPHTDISVPVSQFVDPGVGTVFITENKINGLAFPRQSDAIVVFGLGYGVRSLASADWMKQKRVVYWGDIDTHGFSILSQVRRLFPQTESLLMDQATLDVHKVLCVQEQEAKRYRAALPNLTPQEAALYESLKSNSQGENLRLEQERISYGSLLSALAKSS